MKKYGMNANGTIFIFVVPSLHICIIAVSPLWCLVAWRRSFFKRLGICWLHVELQGVLKHHIAAVLAKYTKGDFNGRYFSSIL